MLVCRGTHGTDELLDAIDSLWARLLRSWPWTVLRAFTVRTIHGRPCDLGGAARLVPALAQVLSLWALRMALAIVELLEVAAGLEVR